jgi:hypothetical protein
VLSSAGEVKLRTKILHNLGIENKCYTVATRPLCIWTGQYNLIYEDHPHKMVGDARFRSAVAICIRYIPGQPGSSPPFDILCSDSIHAMPLPPSRQRRLRQLLLGREG